MPPDNELIWTMALFKLIDRGTTTQLYAELMLLSLNDGRERLREVFLYGKNVHE